jgi:hypothetical protein
MTRQPNRTWTKLGLAAIVAAVGVADASTSEAGESYTPYFGCGTFPNDTYCYGTLEAVRQSSDPNAMANFWSNDNGLVAGFDASLNGVQYSCAFASPSPIEVQTLIGGPNNIEFLVSWTSSGTCYLQLNALSYYQ